MVLLCLFFFFLSPVKCNDVLICASHPCVILHLKLHFSHIYLYSCFYFPLYNLFYIFYYKLFLRLWILNKYNKNEQIPIIDENLIKMCFKLLIKESSGPKPKGNNLKLLEEFKKFYADDYKILNKDIYSIKQDLLNNTLKSNDKYHEWINKHINYIFPKNYKKSYEFDVQNEPQKYIKSMIYMCLEIEKENTKSFQFFPLRTDIVIKFIQIDTKSVIELFIKEDK
jgi:hypothetical protein